MAVFADAPWRERALVILITLLLYAALGVVAGTLLRRWHWGIWLSLPAFLVLFVFGDDLRLTVAYLAAIVTLTSLGALAGVWLRRAPS